MKIKTLLILSSIFLIVCTLIIGSIVFFTTRQTDRVAAQSAKAEEILENIFELSILTQEYIERHEGPAKTQWYLQYAFLSENLASPVLANNLGMRFLASLRSDMEDLKYSFDALVAQSDAVVVNPTIEQQISSDLFVKIRSMKSGADALAEKLYQERVKEQERNNQLILVLLSFLAGVMMMNILVLYRRIIGSIVKFQRDTEIISKGNLDHRLESGGKDEFGALARTFNQMTDKLVNAQRLPQSILHSMQDPLFTVDYDGAVKEVNRAAMEMLGYTKQELIGKPISVIFKESTKSAK